MTISITLEGAAKFRPYCPNALPDAERVLPKRRLINVQQAMEAGIPLEHVLFVLVAMARKSPDVRRRLRLFSADCAARVLPNYESALRGDEPRAAIIAARLFARGLPRRRPGRKADLASHIAARCARGLVSVTGFEGAYSAAYFVAVTALHSASAITRSGASYGKPWREEARWQFNRLAERMSNNEPEDWPI